MPKLTCNSIYELQRGPFYFIIIIIIFFYEKDVISLSNSWSTLSFYQAFIKKMMWLLKSPFNQNHHLINHTPNDNFKSYLIFL
jgi:hypothetical protein